MDYFKLKWLPTKVPYSACGSLEMENMILSTGQTITLSIVCFRRLPRSTARGGR